MQDLNKQVKDFISEVLKKYPSLKMGFNYDPESDFYHIWHTDSKLQFENNDFIEFIGDMIQTYFYNNDIYNISFSYDYFEEQKSLMTYEVKSHFSNFILNKSVLLENKELFFYQMIKQYNSINWSTFKSINYSFDAKDSSIFNQIIRQAEVNCEIKRDIEKLPEEAWAA